MHVEIWSDLICPFCYIGKRRLDQALESLSDKTALQITWRSFQLAPDLQTNTDLSIHQYLAQAKGMTEAAAREANQRVSEMAALDGLDYQLDQAIVANTLQAHALSHAAREVNRQHEAEELLFRAYFTEGKNLDEMSTLIAIGESLGLDPLSVQTALESGKYLPQVIQEINEAEQLRIRAVPFFVFDRKYAISGAQSVEVFRQALQQMKQL